MRKTIIASDGYALAAEQPPPGHTWLDLSAIAHAEISSEDPEHTIEQAFTEPEPSLAPASGSIRRWQAAHNGPQTLRLHFDAPQGIKRVLLHFREETVERFQEFSLSAAQADGQTREVVRQQWTFSPGGSTDQLENYVVNLDGVVTLMLWIDPDRGRDRYPATLNAFRVEG